MLNRPSQPTGSHSVRTFHRSGPVLILAGLFAACSANGNNDLPQSNTVANLGNVHMALQVAPGTAINTLHYDVSGNGFTKVGDINLSGSTTLTGRIDGIPQGQGFLLTVNGEIANDGGTCSGTASFDINRGKTTQVALALRCRVTPQKGGIVINGQVNVCPRIDGVDVTPTEVLVGHTIVLSGVAVDLDAMPSALTSSWTTTTGVIANDNASSATLTCTTAGTGSVTWTVSDGDCSDAVTVAIACSTEAGVPTPSVHINEVESSGGTPGDWIELVNTGTGTADLSGWVLKDNDDMHVFTIPAGTTLPAGGYIALGEPEMTFGLGGGDSARLFDATGVLVDSYIWTAHATTTYGRCPSGTGDFATTLAATRGSANACATAAVDGGAGSDTSPGPDAGAIDTGLPVIVTEPWPGDNTVAEVDSLNQFGDNLSGLTYEPGSAVLWAALNAPSTIFRLVQSGSVWTFDTANDWGAGKAIHYPTGTGNPDTESITKAEWDQPFVYIASERNNDASSVSRLAILRFDTSLAGTSLTATHAWELTADLPATGANLGLEAITWIPDAFLVANGFIDEKTGAAYAPANYPDHGTGLFLVGVEGTGMIHAYALNHATSAFDRLASIPSGHPGVMGLEFDRETGALWAHCDNTCGNVSNILGMSAGKLVPKRAFARPSTLPDSNNEGIAIAPESECIAGKKRIFWSDDSHFAGHALRADTIPCGPLF